MVNVFVATSKLSAAKQVAENKDSTNKQSDRKYFIAPSYLEHEGQFY
jgi:hypothetical protein